jgi:hypothetical protein
MLTGGCLCGALRYTLREGFRFSPYAWHCTLCQTRTGSAFSKHMLFALTDIATTGLFETGISAQPSGGVSATTGCARCKTGIYAVNSTTPHFPSLRGGTWPRRAEVVPAAHLWVGSKQPWIVLPEGVPALAEQPSSQAEWMVLVGPQTG